MVETVEKKSLFQTDGLYFKSGSINPFSGIAVERFDDGKISLSVEIFSGKFQGFLRKFDRAGKIIHETKFHEGLRLFEKSAFFHQNQSTSELKSCEKSESISKISSKLSKEGLKKLEEKAKRENRKISDVFIDEVFLEYEEEAELILAKKLKIPIWNGSFDSDNQKLKKLLTEDFCKNNLICPFKCSDEKIFVAMEDPLSIISIDEIQLSTNLKVVPFVSSIFKVLEGIENLFGPISPETSET